MRTLILYESKHGATKKVAELLGEKIENSVVARLQNFVGKAHNYDRVILGGPIYAGKLHPIVKKYFDENQEHINAIFVSGMRHESADQEIHDNLPDEFIDTHKVVFVGGAYDFSDMNFFERLIVRLVDHVKHSKEDFIYEQIEELIKA